MFPNKHVFSKEYRSRAIRDKSDQSPMRSDLMPLPYVRSPGDFKRLRSPTSAHYGGGAALALSALTLVNGRGGNPGEYPGPKNKNMKSGANLERQFDNCSVGIPERGAGDSGLVPRSSVSSTLTRPAAGRTRAKKPLAAPTAPGQCQLQAVARSEIQGGLPPVLGRIVGTVVQGRHKTGRGGLRQKQLPVTARRNPCHYD